MTFEDLKLTRQFLNAVEEAGYAAPTEIQVKAIPPILGGQDVIGIAQTGTGKTAAYLLPILQILKYAQGESPRLLILVPTKELVLQVAENATRLAKYTDLRIAALYGGVGPKTQIETLSKGTDLIIATPGRLMELYQKGVFQLKKVKHLVLDECDRMMDMGFWPQIRDVQEMMPQKKQLLLFSATFPDKVQRISDNFMLFPTRIEITPQATPAATVEQFLYEVPNTRTKTELLYQLLLNHPEFSRVIVFSSTRDVATHLFKYLDRKELGEIRLLHSNKGQNARINAMNEFSAGDVRVLVTTDVTSRGIDVLEVSHVINFTVPKKHEDYVHRIGRTGRAFKTGTALTFADQSEEFHIAAIEKLIRQPIQRIPLPADLKVSETPFREKQEQLMEIDRLKRLADPTFKGAFHAPGLVKQKKIQAKQKEKLKDQKKDPPKGMRKKRGKKFKPEK